MRVDIWTLAFALALPVAAQQRGIVGGVSVANSPVEAGAPVEITVTGTNPCGAVRLNYGDGTEPVTHPLSQVPATVRYVYKQPGRYEIRAEGMGNCDGVAAAAIQVVGAPTPPPPPRQESRPQIRFQEMDQNNDGVITRAEWRGNERSFRQHDWNNDGILSGGEVRIGTDGVLVKATERWTDTGIFVREGESLRIDASGSVQLSGDPADHSGPGGSASGRRAPSAPLSSRPAGALIARVGNSSAVFIGNEQTWRAPAGGRLFLGINDDHLGDNRGEFIVRIDVERRGR